MRIVKAIAPVVLLGLAVSAGGCSSIRESRGYITDARLAGLVQPGIDNRQSVEATLGRPTFASQFGPETWYYVSSVTARKPFVRPRIEGHSVLEVSFDGNGNVVSTDRKGMEDVVYLRPDGDQTPTLGRERGFLEDLFGNIGTVGAGGPGAPGGG
ncbi:MAG: outer membrane protein assembly factor BamE [Erythrobacter sp.]|nr:outer membrane protein assembly factor BamE [Erythrobacter sp.]NCQ64719.1 outer membrane protein assembly factor BamE [Alphaproteobacteria bacterium]